MTILKQKWVHPWLLLALFWTTAFSGTLFAEDPYEGICQKNAFRLKPRPVMTAAPAHGPFPKIRLTGITTILRDKRALLKVEFPGKPADKADSYILTEGQKAGPIEVLQIDVKTAHVTVDYSGTVTNLTFDKTSPSPAPSAPINRWRGNPIRRAFR